MWTELISFVTFSNVLIFYQACGTHHNYRSQKKGRGLVTVVRSLLTCLHFCQEFPYQPLHCYGKAIFCKKTKCIQIFCYSWPMTTEVTTDLSGTVKTWRQKRVTWCKCWLCYLSDVKLAFSVFQLMVMMMMMAVFEIWGCHVDCGLDRRYTWRSAASQLLDHWWCTLHLFQTP